MVATTYTQAIFTRGARTALSIAATQREPSLVDAIAKRQTSDGRDSTYVGFGDAPVMRLLRDELEVVGIQEFEHTIENERYAVGVAFKRDDMRDDKAGAILDVARRLSLVALNFPNKLLVEALVNATSLAGYDGVSFFNDAHPARGTYTATQDNLLAGTGITSAALRTDIVTGVSKLRRFVGEHGDPVDDARSQFMIVCPPELAPYFNEAILPELYATTTNKLLTGMSFNVFSSARLADANDWYLVDRSNGEGPFIAQTDEDVETIYVGEGSDLWKIHDKALFKVTWRGAMGYGHWARAVKFVNA